MTNINVIADVGRQKTADRHLHENGQNVLGIEEILYKVITHAGNNKGLTTQEEAVLREKLSQCLNSYFKEMSGIDFIHAEINKMELPVHSKILLCYLADLIQEIKETFQTTSAFVIKNPEEVYKHFYYLKFLSHEIVKVLYLNARNELIKSKDVALGDHNSATMKPWNIFGTAFQINCSRIIIVHNHPTGKSLPSESDIRFTRRVQECARVLAIQLVDHIIIGSNYYSFRYNDLL